MRLFGLIKCGCVSLFVPVGPYCHEILLRVTNSFVSSRPFPVPTAGLYHLSSTVRCYARGVLRAYVTAPLWPCCGWWTCARRPRPLSRACSCVQSGFIPLLFWLYWYQCRRRSDVPNVILVLLLIFGVRILQKCGWGFNCAGYAYRGGQRVYEGHVYIFRPSHRSHGAHVWSGVLIFSATRLDDGAADSFLEV